MPLQPNLFDNPPKSQEPEVWEQPIETIATQKDTPVISLAELIPANALLELTRHYEIRSIHLSRVLHLLDETRDSKLTLEQIAQQLSIPSARTEATLSFGRKAGMITSDHRLTRFGILVVKENPFLDNKGLLWLLHYLLASNARLVVWSLAFNNLSVHKAEVDLSEISQALSKATNKWSEKTLRKKAPAELRGTFRCYTEEIFSALDLITHIGGTKYEFNSNTAVIPPSIWLSSLLVYRDQYYPGAPSLEIPLIVDGNFSPGRIFRQNQASVRKAMDELDNEGLLTVETRSGLDQVRFKREITWLSAIAQHLKGGKS
jgi:hypothetical protein